MNRKYDTLIQTPFRCILAGPSGCGKTALLTKLLQRSELFDPQLEKPIKYYYKETHPNLNILNVEYLKEKPNIDSIEENSTICIDDWMSESSKDDSLVSLFTRVSRHRNVSIFLIVQNFFFKNLRTLTLNATHIVLFKNPRDCSFVSYLSRQMFPYNKRYLQAAFDHATRDPHSYLIINTTQQQDENHRLSSSFFPEEAIVYLPVGYDV